VDVFFIHPTTFNGGHDWNGPIADKASARELDRVMLPNYAGPFGRVGRVFAPRYRQASLYAYKIALREDARDARVFAYDDVQNASVTTWRTTTSGARSSSSEWSRGAESPTACSARRSRPIRASPASWWPPT
jgi:hypothetical protein